MHVHPESGMSPMAFENILYTALHARLALWLAGPHVAKLL
jgi:hypothetical protein